jgi:hypothetical protein
MGAGRSGRPGSRDGHRRCVRHVRRAATGPGRTAGADEHCAGGEEDALGDGLPGWDPDLSGAVGRLAVFRRRALGATKGHIRTQFLSEAVLLGLLGGSVGVALGAVATAIYAHIKHWPYVIPVEAWAGGIAASLIIGAVAGLIPALRAARLSPTQALWSV